MSLKNRVGKILMPSDFMDMMLVDELELMFGDFYPVSIDYYKPGKLMYIGCSLFFDEIEPGDEIPEYCCKIVTGDLDGFVEFEKVGDGEPRQV